MGLMETSVFTEKDDPDDHRLLRAQGKNKAWWAKIKKHVREKHGDAGEEWKYLGVKSSWT